MLGMAVDQFWNVNTREVVGQSRWGMVENLYVIAREKADVSKLIPSPCSTGILRDLDFVLFPIGYNP